MAQEPLFPPRADFDDTATYSAVATNVHGQVSTNAAVVVKRECARGGRAAPWGGLCRTHRGSCLAGFRGEEEPLRSVGLPIGCKSPVSVAGRN